VANAGFPAFRIRVFAGSPEVDVLIKGLPSAQQALFEDGIPLALVGGRYEADSGLSVVERTNRAPVVRFGTSGLSYAVGIDVVTGNVVEVINDPSQHTNLINTRPVFFTQTVRALVERFPYYSRNAGYDEVDALAKELRNIIRSIDPEAAVPGNYWPGFVDDVQMGDFNTEDVLEWESRLGSWRQ
jgi:hypothetical protein